MYLLVIKELIGALKFFQNFTGCSLKKSDVGEKVTKNAKVIPLEY